MKQTLFGVVLTMAFSTAGVQPAAAQTATETFMLVPGIPGDSANARYTNWIDVFSLSQSFTGGAGKGGGACTVSVVKGLDRSGPRLWAAAVTGQIFPEIRIEITRGGDTPQRFYELTLTNAFVSSINSTPSDLLEGLTITGSSATLRYFPQDHDGGTGAAIPATVSCK